MEFYRYKDYRTTLGASVELRTYFLVRETPCGYWISSDPYYRDDADYMAFYGDCERWVSKTSRKRFAYPTKKEALDNFIARKRRQIQILTHTKAAAESALNIANKMAGKPKTEELHY